MKIELYYMACRSPLAWASDMSIVKECTTYIKIDLNVFWNKLPFFTVQVPDKSFNGINLIGVLLRALESESIGMQKYSQLKHTIRLNGMWRDL